MMTVSSAVDPGDLDRAGNQSGDKKMKCIARDQIVIRARVDPVLKRVRDCATLIKSRTA